MRQISKCCLAAQLACVVYSAPVLASDLVQIDFVKDKPFPASQAQKEKKREFAESITYDKEDLVVTVSGENEFGGAVDVSRRGPGGLGVKGNGDRNPAGEGTTSGNRVNNGETLLIRFTNRKNEPMPVLVKSLVIDRIVTDNKNFPEAGATTYKLLSNDKTIGTGELPTKTGSTRGGPASVAVEMDKPVTELRITNGESFHPIANRFRVGAISVVPGK